MITVAAVAVVASAQKTKLAAVKKTFDKSKNIC